MSQNVAGIDERASMIFDEHMRRIHRRTDRMFALLMCLQWIAGIGGAMWLTPRTWEGEVSYVHPHVWFAVFFGGALSVIPVLFTLLAPGERCTRNVIAVSQALFSSLLIQITGGRIETHFHIFGSLAFLAAYRDWKLLIPPTLIVAADHLVRGMFWPESVFGIAASDSWRWVEHAGWVIFEDVFLIISCRQGVRDVQQVAERTAASENARVQIEEKSQQVEHSFRKVRAIIEGALDGIVEMDLAGRIIGWNAQAAAMFGWSHDEAVGRVLSDLIIPEKYRSRHSKGLEIFRQTGHGPALNQRIELEGLHSDGHVFPLELAITPIERGAETTFCAFVRDITERRTGENQLRSAKEDAEQASRAKSEFLANMSHEIRTPLNGILGFTEVLQRGVGSEEQRAAYLDTIHSSGQHLLTVINDILDLSKIEAGRIEYEKIRCSPHEIITEVLSVLRVRAQEKCLRLECQWTSPAPETICTDPARLRQLLMNLVSNAIKFTERGSVMVRAHVDQTAAPRLVIDVEDTGIGIPEEYVDRIFRPFDQGDNSITRRFGGTGLGLAISGHIAEALGGNISVVSQVGKGSTFHAEIETGPLDGIPMIDATASEALRPRSQPKQTAFEQIGPARVLLVEDGETNRELITLVLREAGATVHCATNGQEGYEMASGLPLDLILMDMQMPVMDGYSAARALRANGCKTPIIALTAHSMRGDKEKCLAAGCDRYLTKPVQIDRLLEAVAEFTSKLTPRNVAAPEAPARAPRSRIVSTLPMSHPRLREMVESFLVRLPGKLAEMQSALDSCDWHALTQLAHWLKGTGGTVGYQCLTDAAAELEKSAKSQGHRESSRHLDELTDLTSRLAVAGESDAVPSEALSV